MKKKFLAMFAAAVLLLGMTGCSKADNPSTPPDNTNVKEKSLVGPTNTNLGGEDAIDINDTPQDTWGR